MLTLIGLAISILVIAITAVLKGLGTLAVAAEKGITASFPEARADLEARLPD